MFSLFCPKVKSAADLRTNEQHPTPSNTYKWKWTCLKGEEEKEGRRKEERLVFLLLLLLLLLLLPPGFWTHLTEAQTDRQTDRQTNGRPDRD